jgi:hypothetical protein
MTHRLSILQQNILALCFEQKFMSCKELLSELWGLPLQEQGTQKATIDRGIYASAHASLSRSLTRLWSKNLIVYWKTINPSKTGITLTPEGQTLIRAILEEPEDA